MVVIRLGLAVPITLTGTTVEIIIRRHITTAGLVALNQRKAVILRSGF